MCAFRFLATGLSAALILLPAAASAQALRAISTVRPTTASRAIVKAVRQFEPFNEQNCTKGLAANLLALPGPIVMLTTHDCLAGVDLKGLDVDGPGVGSAAFLFTLDDDKHRNILSPADGEFRLVGLLHSEQDRGSRLRQALQKFGHPNEPVPFINYQWLLEGLAKGQTQAIAVFDDGSGAALADLEAAVGDWEGNLTLHPISLATPTVQPSWKGDLQIDALAHAVPSSTFRSRLDLSLPAALLKKTDPLVIRVASRVPVPELPRPQPESRWAVLNPRTWYTRIALAYTAYAEEPKGPPPMMVELPILVARGVTPARFDQMVAAMSSAALIAPLDALINPCRRGPDVAYYAFVRAAAQNHVADAGRVTPLWEHHTLRSGRNEADDGVFTREVTRLSALGGVKGRMALIDELRKTVPANTVCQLQGSKPEYSRGRELAFYQRAVTRLRQAFIAKTDADSVAALNESGACLLKSVESGSVVPTCGAPLSGLWTDYYAPFLPIAVVAQKPGRLVP